MEFVPKKHEAPLLFVYFFKAFDSIHREKMEQILRAHSLPKETVRAVMKLHKNTTVKVCSPDGEENIVAGVVQGDTLAPYLSIICLDYTLRMLIDLMKENGFIPKRQEPDDTQHKLLRTQTTQMTYSFLQIHLPKPNPCSTVWNRQQVALASMSMQTKRSTCA